MVPTGHVKYFDRDADLKFSSTAITCLTILGHHAIIVGNGEASGAPVSFQVELDDSSKNGTNDTFSITLSNGYSRSGIVTSGNIKVTSCGLAFNSADDLGLRWFSLTLGEKRELDHGLAWIPYDSSYRLLVSTGLINVVLATFVTN
jgi:hypothetical protein